MAGIGSSLGEAHAAATAPTTAVFAAAEDEVSAAVASLFSQQAKLFQGLTAQAPAFHGQFVQAVYGPEGGYVAAEVAAAMPLQSDLQALAAYSTATYLTGRP
ncbi:PE family protein [Mycobacterium sp. 050134]|uniref:PE family protein n=1 Tax=Mycobacterium sp. 050134 TaxID=3096111 RepID=UPI003FA55EA5